MTNNEKMIKLAYDYTSVEGNKRFYKELSEKEAKEKAKYAKKTV